MAGFAEDAADPRLAKGVVVNQIRDQFVIMIQNIEQLRTAILQIQQEVSVNADGHFTAEDLTGINERVAQAKTRLETLASTFVVPP